ncbi:iron complex outermembrane receptor protein [Paucibacter oligotrophus]|uniref:Iron complex outermembrane receptor protein n=1 Tax=Roseateles oligotrophus TaxID=1769250 RepID=A0A840LC77_9BURK|nr:TonB-dependent receptor [Roseateles oligotrophus]MBB4845756.1 iron complex outermembrane receptor protein [Roseateles oligotrophus]
MLLKPSVLAAALAAAFLPAHLLSAQAQAADKGDRLERVTVTGSNILSTQREGANPVQTLTAKDIAASGKTTLPELLRSLTANSGNSFNEQFTGSFSAGTAGMSLRGLGQQNTLVLVNGRRVAPYATAQNMQEVFSDLNSLPLAGVRRIEILKDGASALYGSDAIAGVVNILLYEDFQGSEIRVGLGSSTEGTGQRERSLELRHGFGDLTADRYNLSLSFDAVKRDRLDQSQVAWLRDNDFRNQGGGSLAWVASNYLGSDPTNKLGGEQGPLKLVNYADISPGKTGTVLAYNPAQYKTLIPGVERYHASARGTYRINDNIDAYAEVLLGKSRAELIFAAPLTVSSSLRAWNDKTQSLDSISVALPKDHPNYPASGSNVLTATLFDLGPRMKQDSVQFQRLLAGARGTTGAWDWEASVLQSGSRMRETAQNFVNRYEFERALKAGSYNFAEQSKNSEAQRQALRLSTLRPAETELYALDANASAELTKLPAGPLGFAAGLQLRHERMDSRTSEAVLSGTELRPAINIIQGSRRVSAGYAEFNAPLLKTLTLNVAGRLDHYSDFGAAFSPKASLRYQPAAWLVLRGNASQGFRAPSLPENTQSTGVSYGSVVDPRDPISPTVARGVTNLTAANPALKPERSRNLNFGIVVSPDAQTSFGIDYFNIRQQDLIDTETAKYIVDNEQNLPGRIARDEQGRIVSITRQFKNQGERTVSGFDIEASRGFGLGELGQLKLRAQISRLLQFKAAPAEGEAPINGAGSNEFGSLPIWRSTSSANWSLGGWSTTLSWNHVGGYGQTYRPTAAHAESVGSINTVDLNVDWQISPRLLATATVQNLAASQLPWDASTGTFDGSQGDPRGRFLGLKAQYRF